MIRRLVSVALVAALGSLGYACEPACGSHQTRADVHGGRGGYVCVPNPSAYAEKPTPAPAPSSSSDLEPSPMPPPPTSSATPSPSPAPSTCSSQDAGKLDVHLVARDGAADVLPSSSAPNGVYSVVQATAFGTSATYLPIDVLRAELKVMGARLELGAQAVQGGAAEPLETFVLTHASGVFVKVCESRTGAVSLALVPGADGSTRAARMSWDGARAVLTLVVASAYGDVELVLVPKT